MVTVNHLIVKGNGLPPPPTSHRPSNQFHQINLHKIPIRREEPPQLAAHKSSPIFYVEVLV